MNVLGRYEAIMDFVFAELVIYMSDPNRNDEYSQDLIDTLFIRLLPFMGENPAFAELNIRLRLLEMLMADSITLLFAAMGSPKVMDISRPLVKVYLSLKNKRIIRYFVFLSASLSASLSVTPSYLSTS